jgi:23S rRNA G2445 N2-methylase RlmL
VRVVDDKVDISIDTSGDALYLRGYKTQTVDAPLRETLAAALYWICRRQLEEDPALVLDPMCGAGTLIFEALGFWSVNRLRRFAYENFPHAAAVSGFNFKKSLGVLGVERGLGFDFDPRAVEAAIANGRNFSRLSSMSAEFAVANVNELTRPADENAVILINPPYNERLKADQEQLEEQLGRFLKSARPRLVGLIWPGELPKNWTSRIAAQLRTTNGGIPITMGLLNF